MIDAAELKTIFEKDYNRSEWLRALRQIFYLKDLHATPHPVELPANDYDARALEMGYFETSEGLLIGIFEVSISPDILLEKNKAGLRNMMRRVYQRDMDAALLVFTQGSSWRFSYASELTVVNNETGKREKRQTDPKRYTYLLGKGQHCRTAAERFASLKTSVDLFETKVSIKEIEKAFSVDILTKDFYRELSNWYFWALNHIAFPDDDEPNAEARNPINLIRLITRLIFVWFLKQKNLVPGELFEKDKIWPQLMIGYDNDSVYYKAILQNLFFATLNQEMNKRAFRKIGQNYNITNLYRYRRMFVNPDETIKLFKNIPFLNGGLFECLDKAHPTKKTAHGTEEIVRIDGFSDREDNPLCVPDYLFFGGARAVDLSQVYDDNRQKNVNIRGIIEILNSYNFTVEENTPLEIQVALDPELLGKVFENLLASYNPETKTTARKQTGSFYTPREIVNYMVDESLIAYLKQKLGEETVGNDEENEASLRELVSYSGIGNPFDETKTQIIVKAIDDIKVLDPACGSGAFPMGILQQLVHVLQKLDPHNHLWKQLQMQRAQSEIQEAITSGDTANFADRLKEIAEAFDNNAQDYGRKLYLIENCIYGVDIQPIAVQIAKLRFFISLLVDQCLDTDAVNLGIRALPNLETKFVAANSLIPINRQGLVLRTSEVIEKEKVLKQIRHKYFIARTPEQKRKMRAADEKLREEIAQIIYDEAIALIESNKAKLHLQKEKFEHSKRAIGQITHPGQLKKYLKNLSGLATEIEQLEASIINPDVVDQTAKLLAGWNPYEQNRYAGFFDPEWMFGIKEGFDVVIGNPPYVQMQKNNGFLADQMKDAGYSTFERTGDLYALFYELGFKVLNHKGVHTFITSSQWLKAAYGKSLRKLFISKNPIKLIALGPGIFETAVVDTNILIAKNESNKNVLCGTVVDKPEQLFLLNELKYHPMPYVTAEKWAIMDNGKQIISEKINAKGKILSKWNIEIYRGVTTGLNDAFVIEESKAKQLICEDKISSELLKPILRGKEIEKYYSEWDGGYLISTFPSYKIDISKYKAIKQYLETFLPKIKQVGETFKNINGETERTRKKTTNEWFETSDATAYHKSFSKEKIIWKRIGSQLRFSYFADEVFSLDSTCILTGEKVKYLTALLNSKLFNYQLFETAPRTGMGDLIISVQAIEPLLVYYPTDKEQKQIEELVDEILKRKKTNQDTTEIEREIDELVYKLYDLTYAEVKIIDPDFWLSEEEYDNLKME